MKSATGCVVALLSIPVLIVLSVVANAYALSVLWGWFVVPLFALPALSIPVAMGLSVIVNFMTSHSTTESKTSDDDEPWETLLKAFIYVIFRPGFALLFGWIIHSFM